MEENYKMDITSYLADFIIYTIMSILSVGGFFALSQRLQRERLSIYYLNGASWNVCMALDIIKNIITVAIPGIIAISIEKLRLYVSYGSPGGIVVEDFLTNVLKMDVSKARDLIFKFGIRQGTNNLVIDSGSYMDEYSFLYAFLLIAGIYLLSSVLFHISIMRTKPAEEIRNWQ